MATGTRTRLPLHQLKVRVIGVRLTDDDIAVLEAHCARSGHKVSTWLRDLALTSAREGA